MWEKSELDRLYDTIFIRKSVRKYEQTALDSATLDSIQQKTSTLTSPAPASPVVFRILTKQQVKGMNPVKAPHYLAVYAPEGLEARVNAGFMLQQMDLWLSAKGFGCCWLGMPNPALEVKQADGLPFVIMLGFGRPAQELHRKSVSEFKRKPLAEITDLSGVEQLLEPVRLAPSAMNRQPWYLTGSASSLRIHCKNGGFISKAMLGDMPKVDIGIALCHLWLSAEKNERFLSFVREGSPTEVPSGHTYAWTVNMR